MATVVAVDGVNELKMLLIRQLDCCLLSNAIDYEHVVLDCYKLDACLGLLSTTASTSMNASLWPSSCSPGLPCVEFLLCCTASLVVLHS